MASSIWETSGGESTEGFDWQPASRHANTSQQNRIFRIIPSMKGCEIPLSLAHAQASNLNTEFLVEL
jgi:hypothetical protein